MSYDFRAALEELAERVRRNPLLELLRFEVRAPGSDESLAQAEERLGSPLPAAVRDLYSTLGGATLRWRFSPQVDEPTRARVTEEFAQAVTRTDLFDEAGAVDILPLHEMLFDEEYALPQSEPDEGRFDFDGVTYSDNEFSAMLRPFDAVNDFFAMAFVVQPGREDWKMMWLGDYWIEYDSSRVTYLEDYLRYVIGTWGLINAREELFGSYRGDRDDALRFDAAAAAARVPAVLSGR